MQQQPSTLVHVESVLIFPDVELEQHRACLADHPRENGQEEDEEQQDDAELRGALRHEVAVADGGDLHERVVPARSVAINGLGRQMYT